MKKTGKKVSKKVIVISIIAVLVLALAIGGFLFLRHKQKSGEPVVEVVESEATAQRRDIVNTISATSVVEPKDSYEITALVSGDVIYAGFEKGDIVNKDDVLYRIDASDTEKSLTSAGNALSRSQKNYNDAVKAASELTVVAEYSGKVSEIPVKKGSNINSGGVIANVYDDTSLDITVPFIADDAANIYVGQSATVSVVNNGAQVTGSVTKVMNNSYANSSRMMLRDVTVRISNPGALTPNDSATVEVAGMYCNDTGKFEYVTEETLSAKQSGEIKELYIKEGDYVTAGQKIALIENDSVTDAVENARLSLNDSQLSYESAQDRVDDYVIKAPISGTVIEKNVKVGDKLDNTNTAGSMAIIYDMSVLTFDLSIDETDIGKIQVGQSVSITADAIEGKNYNGVVTNVSVVGTTSYGITTYPVTVEITEFDDELLPGMNIEAVINISNATNVIAVPISAVNRGNTVYVKGEKESEDDKAPDGFKTVKVEIGESDGMYLEIKSGLNEGDTIKVMSIISTTRQGGEEEMTGMMPGGMGGMPAMGGGGMPNVGGGGMPGGNMGGGNRQGGGMPGGGMR